MSFIPARLRRSREGKHSPKIADDSEERPNLNTRQAVNKADDTEGELERASAHCAQGRQYWTNGRWHASLAEFQKALVLLEGLLGTFHALTAKTYYWMGFLYKHKPEYYPEALQAFVQTARIRILLLGKNHESTQEAIAAVSWVLHAQHVPSSDPDKAEEEEAEIQASIEQYVANLYESLQLESKGDSALRQRHYRQAVEAYQQALELFQDDQHAVLMGKRAFAHRGLRDWDQALLWYRHALRVFCNTTVQKERHPDVPVTLQRMIEVLQEQHNHKSDASRESSRRSSIPDFFKYKSIVLKSVSLEYEARQVRDRMGQFARARALLHRAYGLEMAVLGPCSITEALQEQIRSLKILSSETHVEQTLASLQGQCQRLQQELLDQQRVAKESSQKIQERENQEDLLTSENDDQNIENLQRKIQAFQERAERAEQQVVTLESTVKKMKSDHSQLEVDNRKLQQQLAIEESVNNLSHGSDGGKTTEVREDAYGAGSQSLSSTPKEAPRGSPMKQLTNSFGDSWDCIKKSDSVDAAIKNDHLEKDLQQSQNRVQWLEQQCQTLEETVHTQESLIDELQASANAHNDLLEQAYQATDEKSQEAKQWQRELEQLQLERDDTTERLLSSQSMTQSLEEDKRNMQLQVQEMQSAKAEVEESWNSQLEKVAFLEQERDQLKSNLQEIKSSLGKVRQEYRASRTEQEQLQEQHNMVQEKLQQAEIGSQERNAQLETLRDDKERVQERLDRTLGQLEQTLESKNQVEDLLKQAQEDAAEQRQAFSTQQSQFEDGEIKLKNELEAAQQATDSLEKAKLEQDVSHERVIAELNEKLTQVQNDLELAHTSMEELQDAHATTESLATDLQSAKLETEMALFKAKEEIMRLTKQHVESSARFEALERREWQVNQDLQASQDELSNLMVEMERFKGKIDYLDLDKVQLEEKVQLTEQKYRDLETSKESERVQYEDLSSILHDTQNKLEETLKEKKTIDTLNRTLEAELANMRSSKELIEAKHRDMQSHRESLESQLDESRQQAESLRHQVAHAESIQEGVRDELYISESKLHELELELANVRHQSEEIEASNLELKQIIDNLEKEKSVLEISSREAQSTIQLNSIDQKSLHADKSEVEARKGEVEKQLTTAAAEVTRFKLELERVSKQLDLQDKTSKRTVAELRNSNLKLSEEVKVSSQELVQLNQRKETVEAKLRASEIDLDLCRHEISSSQAKLRETEQVKKHLKSELEVIKDSKSMLEEQLEKMEKEKLVASAELRKELDRVLQENEVLVKDLATASEGKILYEQKFRDLMKARGTLEEEKVSTDMKISEMEIAVASGERRVAALEEDLNVLNSSSAALQVELDSTKTQIRQIEKAKSVLANRLSRSDMLLEEAKSEVGSLKESLKTKEAEAELLVATEEAFKSLELDRDEFAQQIVDLESSKNILVAKLQHSEEVATRLQARLTFTSKKVSELEAHHAKTEKNVKKAQAKVDSLQSKLSSTEEQLKEKALQLETAQKQHGEASGVLHRSRLEVSKTFDRLKELEDVVLKKDHELASMHHLLDEEKRSTIAATKNCVEFERALEKAQDQVEHLGAKLGVLNQQKHFDDERILRLSGQNQRAAKTITELSHELVKLDQSHTHAQGRLEKLTKLYNALEGKSRVLKDQSRGMPSRSNRDNDETSKQLEQLNETIDSLELDSQPGISIDNDGRTRELGLEGSGGVAGLNNLQEVVGKLRYVYKSESVNYCIRRPFFADDDEQFVSLGCEKHDDYTAAVNFQTPPTISLYARIVHDGSTLVLSDRAEVRHKRKGSSMTEFGSADARDRPLGWVEYMSSDGCRSHYSLDEIVEEAQIYRQQYCESILLSVTRGANAASFSQDPFPAERKSRHTRIDYRQIRLAVALAVLTTGMVSTFILRSTVPSGQVGDEEL